MDDQLTSLCPDPFHHAARPPEPERTVPEGTEVSGTRRCAWCAMEFPVVVRPGRPRVFCRASCRQRAYERRAGRGVLPPVDRRCTEPDLDPTSATAIRRPPAYQAGWSPAGERQHALRPAGRPDHRGRWPTLCGVLASPIDRPFAAVRTDACTTCAEVQELRPSARPFAPAQQLALVRAILEDAGTWLDRRNRWMRGHWVADDHPPRADTFGEIFTTTELIRRLVLAA